jgi:hypothetical protein
MEEISKGLEISPAKVAHIIIRAREYDVKVGAWGDASDNYDTEDDADSILEDLQGDATRDELAEFISNLNDDEKYSLVALLWVGRESFSSQEFSEALETARSEKINKTAEYLLGIPLLSNYLEDGLEKMGYSVSDLETDLI